LLLLALGAPLVAEEQGAHAWISKIRNDHPRLFFNADTWPAVKQRALGVNADHFEKVKQHADSVPDEPGVEDWGNHLMSAAFVYRVTGEPVRLEKIQKMLRASLDFYHQRYAEGKAVNWYSTSRISWLAALDWVWNELTPDERRELAASMLKHVDDAQPGEGKPRIERINRSSYTSGFYGTPGLLWPAGVLTLNEGIDDAKALAFLMEGYDLNRNLLAHRARGVGDDGGAASSTVTYCFEAYPWSEWTFLYTWQSATGEDISGDWPHLVMFPNYVLWNWLPGGYEYGYGDTPHRDNQFPWGWMYTHMSHTMHFYNRPHPEWAALARYVRDMIREAGGYGFHSGYWPVYPFLMTQLEKAPPPRDPGKLPPARHFENMGQVFMRSGSGPEDTYAMFVCGATITAHAHYDANHFVIYKLGHLAIDSGTRYPTTASEHCNNYYRQSVAHNCALIKMPDEPGSVSYAKPIREGGQNAVGGSKVTAFETCPEFTYVAGDATAAYNPNKCSLMVRQFVFIPPDHFVVFDRATSTNADYRKKWVLHTAREPELTGRQFRADYDRGRIFCRTLLPEDAVIQKVGGPGKQFLTDDINWEIEEKYYNEDGTLKHELMGWGRVEVIPGAPRTDDVFLHLIQVGDQKLEAMCEAELIQEDGTAGLRFTADGRTVQLRFATEGEVSGHVRIARGDEVLIDQDLTREVMPQEGLAAPPE
jgi:heparin/heparan-sulfate lyase